MTTSLVSQIFLTPQHSQIVQQILIIAFMEHLYYINPYSRQNLTSVDVRF